MLYHVELSLDNRTEANRPEQGSLVKNTAQRVSTTSNYLGCVSMQDIV